MQRRNGKVGDGYNIQDHAVVWGALYVLCIQNEPFELEILNVLNNGGDRARY